MLTAISETGVWIVLSLLCAGAGVLAWFQLLAAHRVRHAPAVPLADAAQRSGMPSKLTGKVQLGTPALRAPLTGREVAWFRVTVEEHLGDGQYSPVASAEDGVLLRLTADGVAVDVALGEVDLVQPEHTTHLPVASLDEAQTAVLLAATGLASLPISGRVAEQSLGDADLAWVWGTPVRREGAVADLTHSPYRDAPPPAALIVHARVSDDERALPT